MFLLKQIIKLILLPPTPWVVLLVLIAVYWNRRWARKALWAAIAIIYVLHSGLVSELLRYPLESSYAPLRDPRAAEPYDAIVVLMAGTVPARGLVPYPKIDGPLFHRLDEAWRLYRIRPKPIIVSGGHVNPLTASQDENRIARDYLIRWGVPADQVIAEPRSRDTFENAIESGKILRDRGWKRYLLVTSAIHMPRSMFVFRSIAPEPIPAPGDFTVTLAGEGAILPSEDAANKIFDAVHEYAGMANYRWRMRFYREEEKGKK